MKDIKSLLDKGAFLHKDFEVIEWASNKLVPPSHIDMLAASKSRVSSFMAGMDALRKKYDEEREAFQDSQTNHLP